MWSFKLINYWYNLCCAQSLQSCPTLWDAMDCSPPGSSVHGILQARILEWVAMLSSRGSFQHRDWTLVFCVSCIAAAAAAANSLQSCLTLWDPMDCSLPGFSIHGILQARTLEWVAISFSNAWKWKVTVKSLSHVRLLATPWTAAHQAPPSMGFSRQEYWSGVPLPSPLLHCRWRLIIFTMPLACVNFFFICKKICFILQKKSYPLFWVILSGECCLFSPLY